MKRISTLLFAMTAAVTMMAQGWPANYGGVMLQGFYWNGYNDTQWAKLEKQANDLATSFDLIWIPQSGNCGGTSMGYDDLYWFSNYDSSFGNEAQLRSMIQTFKAAGLGTIADVVINHRKNLSNWVDFPKETYKGVTYEMSSTDICADDDNNVYNDRGVKQKSTAEWAKENGYTLSTNKDTGEDWGGMRDLDHKSENVQTIVKAYLDFLLNDLGYAGFRYDMVKGYSASYTKLYNESAKPQFSVGECWDGTSKIRSWIEGTGKTSAAFDFQFRYTVRNAANNGNWSRLAQQNDGNWPLVSNDYQSGNYRQYAVTFVENHDTEKRSDAAQDPLKKDTLAANAYLLAMPGTPCIFLTHWLAYKPELKAMIEARKLAGINNTSDYTNMVSGEKLYANAIDGKLLVVVGNEQQMTPNKAQWTKILSGYHYAYYLARSLETAWADKGSGDFSEPFDVKLTAVSAADDAKIVYTTDGSEPSDTNGQQVASGTSIKISDTTTLKVAILIGSTVRGLITRTFTYKEAEPEPTIVIPEFCKVNEGETCAFFENTDEWSNTIYCWAWTNSPADNFTGGSWPGVECQELGTSPNGHKVWKWTWNGKKQNNTSATQPVGIIFSSKGAPQTDDFSFENGGYYTKDGLKGNVISGIHSITLDECTGDGKVYTLDGRLVRTDGRLDGLQKGIYIVNNRKFILK